VGAERFLTLAEVADVLNISASQAYALVRNRELEAIKIGGRGQWRIERTKLEAYIGQMYDQTRQFLDEHPFVDSEGEEVLDSAPDPRSAGERAR
jgi:excisionase family DNA binding protein